MEEYKSRSLYFVVSQLEDKTSVVTCSPRKELPRAGVNIELICAMSDLNPGRKDIEIVIKDFEEHQIPVIHRAIRAYENATGAKVSYTREIEK